MVGRARGQRNRSVTQLPSSLALDPTASHVGRNRREPGPSRMGRTSERSEEHTLTNPPNERSQQQQAPNRGASKQQNKPQSDQQTQTGSQPQSEHQPWRGEPDLSELLREFFSYLSDRLPRRAHTEMERPRPSESIHSSASQHQCGKTFMTEDRYELRVKRRPRGVRARGGGWRHVRVLQNHLKRKAAERAAPHHTSQSPPHPRRHLTSRDESGSSHDQRHSLEHRMAAKP